MPTPALPSLEHIATAVILLDDQSRIAYLNPAAEHLFALSNTNLIGHPLQYAFTNTEHLFVTIQSALSSHASHIEHELTLGTHATGNKLHLSCTATPLQLAPYALLLEFHTIERPLKLAREEQMLDQTQANRLLLRNLAHEIKNPLGGIRGAAQLLEQELDKPALREYTQVVIQEADRLRSLMEKLLTPQQAPHFSALNIHEVLERVRSVVLAELPEGLHIQRDYDLSLPELHGDKEQLIQVILNIVRNAAQAMQGKGEIIAAHTHHTPGYADEKIAPPRRDGTDHRQRPGNTRSFARQDFLSAGFRPRRRPRAGPDAGTGFRQPASGQHRI